MSRLVNAYMLPTLFSPEDLSGGIAVVIDVLRASTTICHALAAGAERIVPFENIEAARDFREQSDDTVLLGGERFGKRIDGFDLDNSPDSYTAETVRGKTIAFTTTNGTRALHRSRNAASVLIGAFSNLNSNLTALLSSEQPVHLVCAGTDGVVTLEDCLCAGALAHGIQEAAADAIDLNDQAQICRDLFLQNSTSASVFLNAMRSSTGGRNLIKLGFDSDIQRAAMWDTVKLIPEYSVETNTIGATHVSDQLDGRFLDPPM